MTESGNFGGHVPIRDLTDFHTGPVSKSFGFTLGDQLVNFGETLAYWYLRLNGFFPLTNFVLHKAVNTVKHSADADLLAIRFPHVYEEVGGREADWDTDTFKKWEISQNDSVVSLIVEVKTGKNNKDYRENINQSFHIGRLLYGIQRLGIWPHSETYQIAQMLDNSKVYRDDQGRVIAKLLVAANVPEVETITPCLTLPLKDAEAFIIKRMKTHLDPKNSDRRFFPSDLMQYIIWKQQG